MVALSPTALVGEWANGRGKVLLAITLYRKCFQNKYFPFILISMPSPEQKNRKSNDEKIQDEQQESDIKRSSPSPFSFSLYVFVKRECYATTRSDEEVASGQERRIKQVIDDDALIFFFLFFPFIRTTR